MQLSINQEWKMRTYPKGATISFDLLTVSEMNTLLEHCNGYLDGDLGQVVIL